MAWILGAASPSVNANDKLPVPAKDGSFLTLTLKRVNPCAPAKLHVQYGNDLPNPDQVTVKLPTSLQSPAGTLFVRLRAADH